jgi:hypothetical protein
MSGKIIDDRCRFSGAAVVTIGSAELVMPGSAGAFVGY